jgi:hypothetical protein
MVVILEKKPAPRSTPHRDQQHFGEGFTAATFVRPFPTRLPEGETLNTLA